MKMGYFSGLKEAKSTKGGEYIQPGNYLLEIQKVKIQQSQVGGREFFLVETKVIEAQQTDPDVAPNGINSGPTWLVELPGKFPEVAKGNIKNFLTAAFGFLAIAAGETPPAESDIDDDLGDLAIGEENPLVGAFVVAKAFHKKTKSDTLFTRVDWSTPKNALELVNHA